MSVTHRLPMISNVDAYARQILQIAAVVSVKRNTAWVTVFVSRFVFATNLRDGDLL